MRNLLEMIILFVLLGACSPAPQQATPASARPTSVPAAPVVPPADSPAPQQATPAPAAPTSVPAAALQLATIDRFQFDPIKLNRFQSLIRQLVNKFPDTPQQIADHTAMGQVLVRKEGLEESLLNLLEGMNRIPPSVIRKLEYKDLMAMYAVLRSQGWTHEAAMAGLAKLTPDEITAIKKGRRE